MPTEYHTPHQTKIAEIRKNRYQPASIKTAKSTTKEPSTMILIKSNTHKEPLMEDKIKLKN